MTRREQMIIFRGKRIDNGEWVCGFIRVVKTMIDCVYLRIRRKNNNDNDKLGKKRG